MLNYDDLTDGLTSARDSGVIGDDRVAAALTEQGLIHGSPADAGGFTLTDAGRDTLALIDRHQAMTAQVTEIIGHALSSIVGRGV